MIPKVQMQVRSGEGQNKAQQVRRKPVPRGRLPVIVEKPKAKLQVAGDIGNTTGAGAKVYASKFHEEL